MHRPGGVGRPHSTHHYLVRWKFYPNLICNKQASTLHGLVCLTGINNVLRLREHTGQWLHGFSVKIGISHALLVELWVVKHAMEIAWGLGIPKTYYFGNGIDACGSFAV
ncbi:hypothetical protein SLEP1_g19645 [Rubroshorea leprosula]|uniref:Uncharacterized protein n=1 Tax=Rubroshorea leprosula TaxID=152421 RepID=A0AAV5J915_9ROSI|nr:hypothetical protein SLEP1_g19645 [Rubroshorea leprosula]